VAKAIVTAAHEAGKPVFAHPRRSRSGVVFDASDARSVKVCGLTDRNVQSSIVAP
jgi:hypothetical protein